MKKSEMQTELLHFTCHYNDTLVVRLNPEIDIATLQQSVANNVSLNLKVIGGLRASTVSVSVPKLFTLTRCESGVALQRVSLAVTKRDVALMKKERRKVEEECRRLGIQRDKFRLIQMDDECDNSSFLVDIVQVN